MSDFSINTTWRSPNYDRDALGGPKTHQPLGIVIHSDEGTAQSSLPWLCKPASGVSCHYYVTKTGQIYELMPPSWRAWHAGVAIWDGVTDLNQFVGIEVEHKRGDGAYPDIQRGALAWLCRFLIGRYAIPQRRIAAHRWIARPAGRKQDPTDWPDNELRAWIDALYATVPTDPFAAWGDVEKPSGVAQTFAIPRRWLREGTLGRCLGPEQPFPDSRGSCQAFERGLVVWTRPTDTTQVVRW